MNEAFASEIEKICVSKNVPYIDAIVLWCEKHNYEIESAALLIKKDPVLKAKIKVEAENLNALKQSKRGASLPL